MSATSSYQVTLDDVLLATLLGEPSRPYEPLDPGGTYLISRFAWIRRQGEALVAETSLGPCVAVLEDARAGGLLAAFATPRCVDSELAERHSLPLSSALELASLLRAAGLLVGPDEAGLEDEPPLATWEFHDLLFHSRSRMGRNGTRHGATYRFLDRFPPPPALPSARWPDRIALEHPDIEQLEREDPPLTRVQSVRRSIRDYGKQPLTLGELGGFLYRVGRVEDYWEMPLPGPGPNLMSFAPRPYPTGGAIYELELYVAVASCEGLEAGLYHYDAGAHHLGRVSGASPAVRDLIARGAAGMGTAADSMQTLVVLTARVPRIAWKYESIAYELVLKHVGVVLQTMYLVATAMRLAPCAVGTGDSDLFARASGIDYYEESSVGEFALGSREPADG